jgi:hypothetical protein
MNMRKVIGAAFGAALLTAGTGAGVAHALIDGNTTGTVTNPQTATGGTNTATVDPTVTVTAGNTATNSIITHSGTRGLNQRNQFSAKNGNNNANNRAGNKSGSQRFHIG